ncbi:MAG: DUF3291 domain-containing protein [Emcibacteraceae bacterium]|nr:DUF3291 domain-containing protein [Emcibacteraceae bacterium]
MHLAQFNIAKMKGLINSPVMKEFNDNLPVINAIADNADGFIWRLQEENGDATGFNPYDDPYLLVNMSVWVDFECLKDYIMKTGHIEFLKRRYEWFEKIETPNHVMWYVEQDHTPSLEEAKERLAYITKHGDTPHAFSIRQYFSQDDL